MAGIYIHIPFCKQACHYCDFHFSTSLKYKDDMLSAIKKEIALQQNYLQHQTIETVYFGGGTPSLLTGNEINSLIYIIAQCYNISENVEITLEANPDDLDHVKMMELRQTPVNRFSIGVQSFFDEDLQWMNRAHRAKEAEYAIKLVQDAGFENITADLIFGYPLLTDIKWQHNIDTILSLNIPHISAYALTVEPKTALASFISKKIYPPVNDAQSAQQFQTLSLGLQQNGFEHYEISNYAKPGSYSKHNTNYWRGVNYLGVGPSAHSFNGDTRQWNIANNAKYIDALNNDELPAEVEQLTVTNKLNEYIMTSLRTMWGLDLARLNDISKGIVDLVLAEAKGFIEKDYLAYLDNKLVLTAEGKLYADAIAAELFFD